MTTTIKCLSIAFLFVNSVFANVSTVNSQTVCLAKVIYYEASNQPLKGQIAVSFVVINRSLDSKLTVCQVVNQKVSGKRQFTWKNRKYSGKQYMEALELAENILVDPRQYSDPTKGATFFHSKNVNPKWAKKLKRTITIKDHVFYIAKR